ncbi:MAG TPA: NAD-dependent epimerase/dehydratase family protein [Polyangiaceae bacterium]
MSEERTSPHSIRKANADGIRITGKRRVVAVTGAATFLGLNLIGLLEDDPHVAKIVCLDTTSPSTVGQKSRFYELDLVQAVAEERLTEVLGAEKVDTVVHLSLLESPSRETAHNHELEGVGTMQVLNACRRARTQKLIVRSFTWLYGARATNPAFLSEKHALRAHSRDPFFQDKLAVEEPLLRFRQPGQGRVVTVLRTAPIIGPSIENFVTRYLRLARVPTVLGFDPLWQFLHEADAVAALKLAVDRDAPGVFNLVSEGVLPLSMAVRALGRARLPLPRPLLRPTLGALWLTKAGAAPPSLLDYLQYACVADGALAKSRLGFVPVFSGREALSDFASSEQLREANLLSETPA